MNNYSKKLALLGMASFGLAMLVACDDSTTASESTSVSLLEKVDSLPKCNSKNAGSMVQLADSNAVYYCANGEWLSLNGANGKNGKNGTDGASCTAKDIDEGVEVSCDGVAIDTLTNGTDGKDGIDGIDGIDGEDGIDGIDGEDGIDGIDGFDGIDGADGADGISCTATPVEGGVEVSCGGTVIGTLTNGKDGADGEDGSDGLDGLDGDDGLDGIGGQSCTAKSIDEGIEVSCGGVAIDTLTNGKDGANGSDSKSAYELAIDNGYTGTEAEWLETLNGSDGSSCTVTANSTGYTLSCGGTEIGNIANGTNGADGANCEITDKGNGTVSVTCGTSTTTLYKAMCGNSPYDPAVSSCKNNIVIGTVTDSRDGQTYKIVTIGKQTWMAENLNYKGGSNMYHNNNPNNVLGYGRLYRTVHDSLCPAGWRLPTEEELEELLAYVTEEGDSKADVATKLKSTDWDGTDIYGFNVLPSGNCGSSCWSQGSFTAIWSSTIESESYIYYALVFEDGEVSIKATSSDYNNAIRCIQNPD